MPSHLFEFPGYGRTANLVNRLVLFDARAPARGQILSPPQGASASWLEEDTEPATIEASLTAGAEDWSFLDTDAFPRKRHEDVFDLDFAKGAEQGTGTRYVGDCWGEGKELLFFFPREVKPWFEFPQKLRVVDGGNDPVTETLKR
jgi:hypothetical protein